jgi:D-alanine-D-alanine ligase-like ATP-grasp enzyme
MAMRNRVQSMRMRALWAVVAVAALCPVLAGASAAASAGGRASASAGGWGKAEEVPGTAALDTGGDAQVTSVSCASAANCSAGGFYSGRGSGGFVVSQRKGIWGKAKQVRGLAALGGGEITSVSCASAANCSAGGIYVSRDGNDHLFVVSQIKGTWGRAEKVTGTAAPAAGGFGAYISVSCGSAGNCSAVGGYFPHSGDRYHVFVVSQKNGTWGTAEKVPGLAALNVGGQAAINSVSCSSARNCSAGGSYTDGSGRSQVFVVSQKDGTWGTAKQVPGTAALNTGGNAGATSVSCSSAGNCSAGGYYASSSVPYKMFVVSQRDGTWGTAQRIPGLAALHATGDAGLASVACGSAGNCSAGGYYANSSNTRSQAFVVSQKNGTWGKAEKAPGAAALNTAGDAGLDAVSCSSAGNCSAGGDYATGNAINLVFQVFVISQKNGTWGKAEKVRGMATLNTGGNAHITAISCGSAGNCSAGGYYTTRSGHEQAFVVSETK